MALISGEIPPSKTEPHLNAKATKLCDRTELYMEHVAGGSWLCVSGMSLSRRFKGNMCRQFLRPQTRWPAASPGE